MNIRWNALTLAIAAGIAISPASAQTPPAQTGLLGSKAEERKQSRLDGALNSLRELWGTNGRSLAGVDPQTVAPGVRIQADTVLIDAIASQSGDALRNALVQLGMADAASNGKAVSGRLPIAALEQADRLSELRFMRAAFATTNAGSVTSQGDPAQRSEIAREVASVDGTPVKVGVLSDSYNCLGGAAADVASGDLPAGVMVLTDFCPGGSDEGRAMMQIVHDVAPGAAQAFSSAFNGQAAFANEILALAAVGSNVIVDDVTYFAEPMFQDGIIAQAVNTVTAQGVSYFSSAGNSGSNAYHSEFRGSATGLLWGANGSSHDFDPGAGVDLMQAISVPIGSTLIMSFQWAQPYASAGGPGATSDLDVALVDAAGTTLLAVADTANVAADPVEILFWTNTTASTQFNLIIEKYLPAGGPNPPAIRYSISRAGAPTEFVTNSATIYGHHNASGAIATAAAPYFGTPAFGVTPPQPESFTSHGGLSVLFDAAGLPINENRAKPDITAPDGGNNTFFGNDSEPDGWPNFFGTSAAAPHAAGVAALMLHKSPNHTPMSLRQCMQQTALDMLTAGYDVRTGPGLLTADNAVLPQAPLMVTPPNLSTLTGATATFVRNGECVSDWWLYVGAVPGGQQYLDTGLLPGSLTSATATTLPVNGSTVYARLWFRVLGDSTWQFTDTSYVAAGGASAPQLTSPAPGSTLTGPGQTFAWSGPAGANYWVYVGATSGGLEYFNSGNLGNATSVLTGGLPTDGSPIYVRLWYLLAGSSNWQSVDATYTAATLASPAFTAPLPGSLLSGTSVPFTWTANGGSATNWWLYAGSSQGGQQYFDSGALNGATGVTVTGLPSDGSPVYVRLWYQLPGGTAWYYTDATYTASGSPPAQILFPLPGATLTGSSILFNWTDNGAGVLEWWLYTGSAPGTGNYHDSGSLGTSTSTIVGGMPQNGSTVYVTLWYRLGSIWQYVSFPYTSN